MFTGIITDIGEVSALEQSGAGRRLTIRTSFDMDTVDTGASIACSGCCLTVVEKGENEFSVDVSGETLSCTVTGTWREGSSVNLERSLRYGDEMGGHMVSGHVDGVAELVSAYEDGDCRRMVFNPPGSLLRHIAPKGSVALDGVSLTVNEVGEGSFGINVIPYTLEHTTLGQLRPGDKVNIEVDLIARYVARLIDSGGSHA